MELDQHLLHVEGAPHLKIKALLYNLCDEKLLFWCLKSYLTFSQYFYR